jgi:hypothetical protein
VKQLLALLAAFALVLVPAAASAASANCSLDWNQAMQTMHSKGAASVPAVPCCKHKACMGLCASATQIIVTPANLASAIPVATQTTSWPMPKSPVWPPAALNTEKPPPKPVA